MVNQQSLILKQGDGILDKINCNLNVDAFDLSKNGIIKLKHRCEVSNAKEYTNIGGIHIIQIFTDVAPTSEDMAPFAIGLLQQH